MSDAKPPKPGSVLPEALRQASRCLAAGQLDQARRLCHDVLRTDPDQPEALHVLGLLALESGKPAEARDAFCRAAALRPSQAAFHCNLGLAEASLGRLDEALACYRRALELNPNLAEAHTNLGNAARLRGDILESIRCYRRAVELRPGDLTAQCNLAGALCYAGLYAEAESQCRLVLKVNPQHPGALNILGLALREQGWFEEAAAAFRQALAIRPDGDAGDNLGGMLQKLGLLDEAIACYRDTLAADPASQVTRSNLLLASQYRPGVSAEALLHAHREWDAAHAAALRSPSPRWENPRDPERTLRLGFVSADFGEHVVGRLLIGVFEALAGLACTTCYHLGGKSDSITERFRAAAGRWRESALLSDEQLAGQIRADGIDILFDMSGHTLGNRLLTFARKPAPIQATWLGYPGTTGLSAIDYLVADRHQVRDGEEACYRESLLRPECSISFDPPAEAPPVARLPALDRGGVTFGSFNNPTKLNRPLVAAWSAILRRVPGSRLTLKYFSFDQPQLAARFRTWFREEGVADRVEFQGGSDYASFLAAHHDVDIALDPFPFSGSATTFAALWMGVPVVTFPGRTVAGRNATSHLKAAGLDEFIAVDQSAYAELAVALAADVPRLAGIRQSLRQRVAQSPLCDSRRLAQNLLALLREAWRRWCAGAPPSNLG
jgi:protein O-GlcNAc transferase